MFRNRCSIAISGLLALFALPCGAQLRATINQPGVTLHTTWKQLGLDGTKHMAQNLWDNSSSKESKEMSVSLPAHGSAVFQVR